MSSLRLALKQSLENSSTNRGDPNPTPFGLSDKELRRLKRSERSDAKSKKEKNREKERKKLRKLKRLKRREAQEELQRRIDEAPGGAEIHLDGGGQPGDVTMRGVGEGGGSSSSTLSSSSNSSGSSSSSSSSSSSDDDDDDDDDSSSSSSSDSSSSSSSDTSSSTSDDDDDDDDSSSDGSLSSSEEGEVKDKKTDATKDAERRSPSSKDDDSDDSLNLKSSGDDNSDSDGDSTVAAADREAKELFDADMSSSDDGDDEKSVNSATNEKRRQRRKKKSKKVKKQTRKKKDKDKDKEKDDDNNVKNDAKDDAANKIQEHWKKKTKVGRRPVGRPRKKRVDEDDEAAIAGEGGEGTPTGAATTAGTSTLKTVEHPSPQLLQHVQNMSTKRQRRSVFPGLRVKVRFVKKANINGRLTRKLKWYGGVVSGVTERGRKIKIHYDDGTSEIADFPDKDIVIDDRGNGRHRGEGGEVFRPPPGEQEPEQRGPESEVRAGIRDEHVVGKEEEDGNNNNKHGQDYDNMDDLSSDESGEIDEGEAKKGKLSERDDEDKQTRRRSSKSHESVDKKVRRKKKSAWTADGDEDNDNNNNERHHGPLFSRRRSSISDKEDDVNSETQRERVEPLQNSTTKDRSSTEWKQAKRRESTSDMSISSSMHETTRPRKKERSGSSSSSDMSISGVDSSTASVGDKQQIVALPQGIVGSGGGDGSGDGDGDGDGGKSSESEEEEGEIAEDDVVASAPKPKVPGPTDDKDAGDQQEEGKSESETQSSMFKAEDASGGNKGLTVPAGEGGEDGPAKEMGRDGDDSVSPDANAVLTTPSKPNEEQLSPPPKHDEQAPIKEKSPKEDGELEGVVATKSTMAALPNVEVALPIENLVTTTETAKVKAAASPGGNSSSSGSTCSDASFAGVPANVPMMSAAIVVENKVISEEKQEEPADKSINAAALPAELTGKVVDVTEVKNKPATDDQPGGDTMTKQQLPLPHDDNAIDAKINTTQSEQIEVAVTPLEKEDKSKEGESSKDVDMPSIEKNPSGGGISDNNNAAVAEPTQQNTLPEKLPEKKKRRPLTIRIGLPKAKRKKQGEEETRSKQVAAVAAGTVNSSQEPNKKKQKLSAETGDNELPLSKLYDKANVEKEEDKKESPVDEGKGTSAELPVEDIIKVGASDVLEKTHDDDDEESLSDGEIQEDDGSPTMKAEQKASEPNTEESPTPSEEPKQSSPPAHIPAKKPKLSIHISTKKRKLHKDLVSPAAAEEKDDKSQKADKEDSSKQQTAEAEEGGNTEQATMVTQPAHSGAKDRDAPVADSEDAEATISPRTEGNNSIEKATRELPTGASSAATSNTASPVPSPTEDAGGEGNKSHTITARSGRKAAKRAAEKMATEKKSKSKKFSDKGTKKKAEEDPWVQCDRCHKWRHLPGTVDLDSLPEHWFCELNTYDPKRNNCEASEQTPKEVAKEKKRAKKLALKKLKMEEAQAASAARESDGEIKSKSSRKGRSTSPKNGSDPETEFDAKMPTDEKAAPVDNEAKAGKHIAEEKDETAMDTSHGDSPPAPVKPKPKRGRPRREDRDKEKTGKGGKGDEPKQEWVQCEKCEKWRRLPPRISAEDLPDVWFCSMNTWDINLATCTAIEDKHEANSPARGKDGKANNNQAAAQQFSEQSQIPTSFGPISSSKLSYRNLIFGSSGRRQKNISERMRAQESLFSSHWEEEDVDMGSRPTVKYANSNAFYNRSLIQKSTSFEDEQGGGRAAGAGVPPQKTSVFDIVSYSRVWQELNNNAAAVHTQNMTAYNAIGYEKYCQPNGSLNQEAVDTLKAMAYFSLGNKTLVGHEILLEVQCGSNKQDWNVPAHWMELRSLCTIEIVNFILEELIKDGLVEEVRCSDDEPPKSLVVDSVFYRRRLGPEHAATLPSAQEVIDQRSSCLKIRKPWK